MVFIFYAILLSFALSHSGFRNKADASSGIDPMDRASRILIVGATGGTGRQLVSQALERGYAVTALVRDPAKLQIDHPQLTVVQGNVLDEQSVAAAMHGQDAVVSALGHKRFFYPTRILSEGTKNILRAMETNSVSRLVCQTSLGVGDSAWRMGVYFTFFTIPVVLPFYFWDKTRQERIIAESKAEWVIVRPGMLSNAQKRGKYRHGFQIGNYFWTVRISRADVAAFMLDQLESDTYLRAAVGVSR
jgi:putative NADH-flavin reductase